MTTLKLNDIDLTKYTEDQLQSALRRAEAIPHKEWTYPQFLTVCKLHLEIELRKEIREYTLAMQEGRTTLEFEEWRKGR